jgi:WD40 repeat protein
VLLAFLASSADGPPRLAEKPQAVLQTRGRQVNGVAFSPDGKILAVACDHGGVELWAFPAGKRRSTLGGRADRAHSGRQGADNGRYAGVSSVAFTRAGGSLAAGNADGTIQLWDLATARVKATISADAQGVWCMAFSGDGKLLASGGTDRVVKLWDVGSGKLKARLKGHQEGKVAMCGDTIMSVAFSGDGKLLASAGADGTIRLWDVATGSPGTVLIASPDRPAGAVAFSPDGTLLASGGYDGAVKLWRVATGKGMAAFELRKWSAVSSVKFSPDGKLLAAVGGDGLGDEEWEEPPEQRFDLKLWDVATGQQQAHVSDDTGQILSTAFSPDGKLLATGDCDDLSGPEHGRVRLWEVRALLEGRP